MDVSSVQQRLRSAILLNDLPLVQRLLEAHPASLHNPNFHDKSNTSLHLAAQYGFLELADCLIALGHDRTVPVEDDVYSSAEISPGVSVNTDGHTALHLGALNLQTPVVELLCRHFPKMVNRSDNEGGTALLLAARGHVNSSLVSSTHSSKIAARTTDDTSTIEALLAGGADIGAQDNKGNTCLHIACAWGNLKAVRALIQAGADPKCTNYAGWPPELYSLTVQAEVYFRNLVAEVERRKMDEQRRTTQTRLPAARSIRLVANQDEDDDDENEGTINSTESFTGRSRADSGRSRNTTGSTES